MTMTGRSSPTWMSEQEMITRCMEGDLEAFGWLFERYENSIYRYAYHMIGDPDEADDIKQDTFVKAYRALSGFRGESTLLTWLLKIAGNLCRDRYKQHTRRREAPLDLVIGSETPVAGKHDYDPATLLERKDLVDTIHRVLREMPRHRRELIVLRDLEGLSYQQIADTLNCSVASVKLRLFRARRMFKERLNSLLRA